MKLNEIIQQDLKDLPFKTILKGSGDTRFKDVGGNIEILGKGFEAMAYRRKDKPNIIKAMGANDDIKGIPYVQYILALKKYAAQNPYFPRVYEIGKAQLPDDEGLSDEERERGRYVPKFVYTFKMEELMPVDTVSDEEWQAITAKTFPGKEMGTTRYNVTNAISNLLFNDLTSSSQRYADPLLIQAVQLIKKVKEKTGATIDMHSGNIMIRRTSVGPQLVITDPLVKFE